MKLCGALLICLCLYAGASRAGQLDLATLTCGKYQSEIITAPGGDSINTMMWLFGYAVGRSGAHVMYGDALAPFGFSLDAECKNNPSETVMTALATIKPDTKNPMDLTRLECETFASRHLQLQQSDRESADTIMMWLFGFAVAKSGSHTFDSGGLPGFEAALMSDCKKSPGRNLFDELAAVKSAGPKG